MPASKYAAHPLAPAALRLDKATSNDSAMMVISKAWLSTRRRSRGKIDGEKIKAREFLAPKRDKGKSFLSVKPASGSAPNNVSQDAHSQTSYPLLSADVLAILLHGVCAAPNDDQIDNWQVLRITNKNKVARRQRQVIYFYSINKYPSSSTPMVNSVECKLNALM